MVLLTREEVKLMWFEHLNQVQVWTSITEVWVLMIFFCFVVFFKTDKWVYTNYISRRKMRDILPWVYNFLPHLTFPFSPWGGNLTENFLKNQIPAIGPASPKNPKIF